MNSVLKLNNKNYKIKLAEIKYVNATNNKQKGYSILVNIDIELNNANGYISFYVDFFKDNNFKNIENKEYIELPTKLDSKITMIEIFDTQNFIDFIDSEVKVKFGNIINKEIEMKLYIKDDLINIEYFGTLNINGNNEN